MMLGIAIDCLYYVEVCPLYPGLFYRAAAGFGVSLERLVEDRNDSKGFLRKPQPSVTWGISGRECVRIVESHKGT